MIEEIKKVTSFSGNYNRWMITDDNQEFGVIVAPANLNIFQIASEISGFLNENGDCGAHSIAEAFKKRNW